MWFCLKYKLALTVTNPEVIVWGFCIKCAETGWSHIVGLCKQTGPSWCLVSWRYKRGYQLFTLLCTLYNAVYTIWLTRKITNRYGHGRDRIASKYQERFKKTSLYCGHEETSNFDTKLVGEIGILSFSEDAVCNCCLFADVT